MLSIVCWPGTRLGITVEIVWRRLGERSENATVPHELSDEFPLRSIYPARALKSMENMMKILVEADHVDLDGDHGPVEGLRLTCERCGHEVEVFGISEASEMRGATMLREECPKKENNFYVIK